MHKSGALHDSACMPLKYLQTRLGLNEHRNVDCLGYSVLQLERLSLRQYGSALSLNS